MKKINSLSFWICIVSLLLAIFGIFFFLRQFSLFSLLQTQKMLYDEEKYLSVVESFSGSTNPVLLHNVWNTYAALAKNASEQNQQEYFLESALQAFSDSLSISENKKTRKNYEIIKKLLENFQKTSEDEAKSENSEDSKNKNAESWNSETSSENSESSENWEDTASEKGENSSSESQNETWTAENDETKPEAETASNENSQGEEDKNTDDTQDSDSLSEEDAKQLQEYSEQLSQMQKNYQQFYGTSPDDPLSQMQEMMNDFFWTVNRGGEKTW